MDATPDRYYQALVSRDARFDGEFYAGVVTTGVYCRPICPAPDPKPINVRYFSCTAAAEAAGFRPCRRCRPDTTPGTPAWLGTSATVSRALRLISEGALDQGGVDDLADRLGVGSRHLRRLFDRHLGASPVQVAQSRRVHFARQLLDETDLPMREIAYASGFRSIKRFNTVIRETFQQTPTALRRQPKTRAERVRGSIHLTLPYREPYDWESMLEYLEARAIPGVEEVYRGKYRRSITLGGREAILEVGAEPRRRRLTLTIFGAVRRELMDVMQRVRRMFDLSANPIQISTHLERDPALRRAVAARPGLRVPGAWDPFELAIRAILGQQVSVAGATTIAGRLVQRAGQRIGEEGAGPFFLFPTAEALAEADLTDLGVPGSRVGAIRELAKRVASGEMSLDAAPDTEEVHEQLTAIPGIGNWTAQYVTMRAFDHPDAFLADDLGVLKALSALEGRKVTPKEALARAETWRPWRAYAVFHLWRSLPGPTNKEKTT